MNKKNSLYLLDKNEYLLNKKKKQYFSLRIQTHEVQIKWIIKDTVVVGEDTVALDLDHGLNEFIL